MFKSIDQVIMIILAVAVIGCSILVRYRDEQLKNANLIILEYQNQLNQLKMDSDAEIRRYDDARRAAENQTQQVQDETRKILATRVPRDCNKAMAWGINEARRFK